MQSPLTIMILIPVVVSLSFPFIKDEKKVKYISLSSYIFNFILSIFMFIDFRKGQANFEEKILWISNLKIYYHLDCDVLSLFMILLTNFTMIISSWSSFEYIKKDIKKYYFWLSILSASMIGVFTARDTFLFYLFWEAMLIPMYFIIGMWGGENRIYATIKFFIYTMSASIIMLVGIIITYLNLKSLGINSFEIVDFYKNTLSGNLRLFVFLSFLIAFAVKIPLFPFHTWLPDAHVEAPTAGSVILAGVLLKMGVYGYLRFLIPMFPDLSLKFAPYISAIGVVGVIYASLMAWVQSDIKKLIAYSSIAHMGLIIIGVFSFVPLALNGAILQMINHGISTGGLFLMIGILYERTHTRVIKDYGGIFKVVPFISSFFMIITLSSIAFPSTNGFIGEITIFLGAFRKYPLITLISISGVIFGAIYMLVAYEKIFFGDIKNDKNKNIKDMNLREYLYMTPIVVMIFFIGIYPSFFTDLIDRYVSEFIQLLGG